MDNLILKSSNSGNGGIKAEVSSIKVPAHTKDSFAEDFAAATNNFLALPLLFPFVRMTNSILREKEKRIKEGMKMMGLVGSTFYLSWILRYFVVFMLMSLGTSAVLKGAIFSYTSFGYIFIWHFTFILAAASFGLMVTTIFNTAKVGNTVAIVGAYF